MQVARFTDLQRWISLHHCCITIHILLNQTHIFSHHLSLDNSCLPSAYYLPY